MLRAVLTLAIIGLVVYTLLDMLRSGSDERLGLPRLVWAALILLVPVLGSIVWLVASRYWSVDKRPLGPDDDPEFLRKITPPDEPT